MRLGYHAVEFMKVFMQGSEMFWLVSNFKFRNLAFAALAAARRVHQKGEVYDVGRRPETGRLARRRDCEKGERSKYVTALLSTTTPKHFQAGVLLNSLRARTPGSLRD